MIMWLKKQEIIVAILLVLLFIGWWFCSFSSFSVNHPAFSLAFLVLASLSLLVYLFVSIRGCLVLSKRKLKVENEIRLQADKLAQRRNLVDQVMTCFKAYTWTTKGDYVYLSRTMQKQLGVTNGTARIGEMLEGVDDKSKKSIIDFLSINKPGNYQIQTYGSFEPGEHSQQHWYELHMHVTQTKRGLEKYGLTVIIDDLKLQEEQALETHRKLMNAQQRERFIGMLNHEIRTPLNSIVGFSQMLSTVDMDLPEEEMEHISRTINDNSESLLKLIGNILLLTHMDNSNVSMQLIESNVAENVCEGCVAYINQRREKDIKVVIEHGPESAWTRLDHQFMVTVVDSFCSNAIKFSHHGGTIYLGWKVEGNDVLIYVRDEGIGISKEHQQRIFERFFKVDSFAPGVGLGLSVAKEFVTRMGGQIEVESELGKGSTFSVRLKMIKK